MAQASGLTAEGSMVPGQAADAQHPEEHLVFALGDGRCGVLSVAGSKVSDSAATSRLICSAALELACSQFQLAAAAAGPTACAASGYVCLGYPALGPSQASTALHAAQQAAEAPSMRR